MSDWYGPAAIGLAILAFVTKPSIADFKLDVDAAFSQARQNTWSRGDISQWAAVTAVDNLRAGQYSDYLLGSTYVVTVGGGEAFTCYGVFGTVSCTAPK